MATRSIGAEPVTCLRQAVPSGGRHPLGGAQVGKALLHSKGGFVALGSRAAKVGSSGWSRTARLN